GKQDPAKGAQAARVGKLRGLARRALHGEATVKARDGSLKVVVFARGTVSAISAQSITIHSEDGVSTTFALDADTKYGAGRNAKAQADIKVGDRAGVLGVQSGDTNKALRVVDGTGRAQGGGNAAGGESGGTP